MCYPHSMARRKDHTRDQLRDMMIDEGHRHLASVGYARFSAKEVARRIGYSFGTVHNVMGGHDDLMAALNTRTFVRWAEAVDAALASCSDDRLGALVRAYFSFARAHPNLWMAIYDHRLPPGASLPDDQAATRGRLTAIIAAEVSRAIGDIGHDDAAELTRSLIATVHGHCVLDISDSYRLMGGRDPEKAALARVRDIVSAAGGRMAWEEE